jgi:hypothetical protein
MAKDKVCETYSILIMLVNSFMHAVQRVVRENSHCYVL